MPSLRPTYAICPGDRLDVEVVQPDGGAAPWLSGSSTPAPMAAGGKALRIRVCEARVQAPPVELRRR
jgi:hypothetical protein